MRFSLRLFAAVFALLSLSCATRSLAAAELPIITKARAFVGTEDKLNGLNSVRYTGSIKTEDGKSFLVEIIFQKPYQHRITITGPEGIEITALDDFDCWQRIQSGKKTPVVRIMGSDQVRRLRANVMANIYFYRGLGVLDSIDDQGIVEFQGQKLHKVTVKYGPQIAFIRYFDPATGRLVFTETESAGSIKEEGDLTTEGIRFPKKIITVSADSKGLLRTLTIEFDKISVNESFASSLFAVPMIRN